MFTLLTDSYIFIIVQMMIVLPDGVVIQIHVCNDELEALVTEICEQSPGIAPSEHVLAPDMSPDQEKRLCMLLYERHSLSYRMPDPYQAARSVLDVAEIVTKVGLDSLPKVQESTKLTNVLLGRMHKVLMLSFQEGRKLMCQRPV
jgi:hypothetical protein